MKLRVLLADDSPFARRGAHCAPMANAIEAAGGASGVFGPDGPRVSVAAGRALR